MGKQFYHVTVFDSAGQLLYSQELWREDYAGFIGHLNKNVPEWESFKISKLYK